VKLSDNLALCLRAWDCALKVAARSADTAEGLGAPLATSIGGFGPGLIVAAYPMLGAVRKSIGQGQHELEVSGWMSFRSTKTSRSPSVERHR
jgi:hypothetical protein